MLFWTHLIVGLFGVLLYMPYVDNKILFVIVALFAAIFPDIDSHTSKLGRHGMSKIITAFAKHRGFFHSLLFGGFVYLLLWNFGFKAAAFAFAFGYVIHLFLDCLTARGIRMFYPFKFRIRGFVRSGKLTELIILLVFLVLDVFLIVARLVL
ncbi:MAG: metal-dependent hydrolase [Nanoarchaeota archaeon]|jgi:inner membrane protein|nr:metal-dependent hydrolase [Nanoarchaeota archaeon]